VEDQDELFFELRCNGDSIIVTPNQQKTKNADWIKANVYIKAGAFRGTIEGDFLLYDFISFRDELQNLYVKLKGTAVFNCLEGHLKIHIKADELGHMEANCEATDQSIHPWRTLSFQLNFDQTYLPGLLKQLDIFVGHFQ
jgi:hypothetical protein